MAENESLDIAAPGGQRWKHLLDAVKKRKSNPEIARQVELKLPKALRKAFKEFLECGTSFSDFMASRDDQKAMRKLIRRCDGHEFANLFQQTASVCEGEPDRQLINSYLDGVVDRVFDQITHKVIGNQWESVNELKQVLDDVRERVQPDMNRIAKKLDDKNDWLPTVKQSSKEQKQKDEKGLMEMSLLGDKK